MHTPIWYICEYSFLCLGQYSVIGKKKIEISCLFSLKHPIWIKQENNKLEPKLLLSYFCGDSNNWVFAHSI